MLKLMNSVIILVILCGGLQFSCGEKFKCTFMDVDHHPFGTLYTCYGYSLDNSFNNMTIDGYTGTHVANKNDKDVKAIWISETKLKYIPHGLGSLFNLTAFLVESSELVEIRSKDFQGMQNLEYLSLYDNNLTSVPSDVFSTLTKLEHIDLNINEIKYIVSDAFDKLTNLNILYLNDNICVNKLYEGAIAITQLKEDLKVNCVEPLSTSTTTTTTTTTTTQNPMEVELKAAKDQQQKNEIELNKLRDDLKKEQLEKDGWIEKHDQLKNDKETLLKEKDALTKDKDPLMIDHDKLKEEKNALMKDRDALMMELSNKTSEIIELKTNCKQPEAVEALDVKLNEMNELLLKTFQNHQNEYLKIVKLKAELSTAKDQQKKEMIDFDQLNVTDIMTLSNKCNSFTMNCNFLDTNGTYTCETRNLFINQKDMELSEVVGTHLKSKSNLNVTELMIKKSSMFYWSKDIFNKFPALQILRIQNAQLNELKKGDLSSASELTVLVVNGINIKPLGEDVFHGTEEQLTEINMNSNQIEKINGGTFHGLKQLKVLSLKDNLITEIPLGTFNDIVMLEILILTGNKIRFLDGKMLEFNKRLMTLAVDQNELREVGEEILNHSKMLKDVNFGGNYCIDERIGTDDEETDERTLNDLIFVIRSCCKNPGEGMNVYNCGRSGSED